MYCEITEYTPPVQFSNSGAQVSFMVITIASLLDPERAYRSIVGQSRDYTQHFPKYSTLHHHQKFSAQYTQAASVHNNRGRVSKFRSVRSGILSSDHKSESQNLTAYNGCGYLSCFTSAVFPPPSLVISIFFFLFHLIWFVELVILGSSRVFQCVVKPLFLIKNSNKNNLWK